jgi:type I restriction enzyme R subunit
MVLAASEELALEANRIILDLKQVDWSKSVDIPKKMIFLIGDYIIDHIREKYDLKLSFKDIDTITERIVDIAKIRYK